MTYFRLLIACCTVTVLALSVPVHAAQEQSEELWLDLKDQLFDERTLHDGSDWLELDAPYRAMDAAIVPISVNVNREQNDDTYIKNLMIVIDENPSPLAAVINMSPTNGNASLDTRIRIDRYTHVRAIAEDNEGNLYTVARFVKAAGGCSAPALADMALAKERMGQMKFKFKELTQDGMRTAQLLISHPNYSGLQFNQVTMREIPSHFVDSVEVRSGTRVLLKVESGISMSENPAFTFRYYDISGNDPVTVRVTDSEGMVFEKEWRPDDERQMSQNQLSKPKV